MHIVTRPYVKIQAPVVVAINELGVLSADLTNSSRLSLILRGKLLDASQIDCPQLPCVVRSI